MCWWFINMIHTSRNVVLIMCLITVAIMICKNSLYSLTLTMFTPKNKCNFYKENCFQLVKGTREEFSLGLSVYSPRSWKCRRFLSAGLMIFNFLTLWKIFGELWMGSNFYKSNLNCSNLSLELVKCHERWFINVFVKNNLSSVQFMRSFICCLQTLEQLLAVHEHFHES